MIVIHLSDPTGIAFTSYLRHLEELGLINSDDIFDGALDDILLRVEGWSLFGVSKED